MADTELADVTGQAAHAGVAVDGDHRAPDGAVVPAGLASPDPISPDPASPDSISAEPISVGPQDVPPSQPASTGNPVLRALGIGLLLLSAVVLGMAAFLYFFSGVQEARTQRGLYTQLQGELANEVAPLGPTAPGQPVAILDIPSIGIHGMVVVEGTSGANLTEGPGHRPDTPLPGQMGVSEIYGRRATFGGPFQRLAALKPGALITAYTGQGKATYRVVAAASSKYLIKDTAPDRLVLVTSASSVVPDGFYQVDARLVGTAKAGPAVAATIDSTELPLAGDGSALAMAMMWAVALAFVSAAGMAGALYWSPWAAWLTATPLLVAVLWNLYENLAVLLPNVY